MSKVSFAVNTEYGPGIVSDATIDPSGQENYFVEGDSFHGWFASREVEFFDTETQESLDLRHSSRRLFAENEDSSFIDDDVELSFANEEDDPADQKAWEWFRAEYPSKERNSMRIFADWADVRAKARRLRGSGKVSVVSFKPEYIKGMVEGDHGVYKVEIGRTEDGQKVSFWNCSCEWGYWAFRRQHTYVGRQCSHALAMYYEMQGLHNRSASVITPPARTSARVFTPTEQMDLIEEDGIARQFSSLNLSGPYSEFSM